MSVESRGQKTCSAARRERSLHWLPIVSHAKFKNAIIITGRLEPALPLLHKLMACLVTPASVAAAAAADVSGAGGGHGAATAALAADPSVAEPFLRFAALCVREHTRAHFTSTHLPCATAVLII